MQNQRQGKYKGKSEEQLQKSKKQKYQNKQKDLSEWYLSVTESRETLKDEWGYV